MRINKINRSILKKIYKKRAKNAKKYDFGLLLVIGGSEFYSGAPALSALAAFRAGVDMVRIIAPKRAANIIASFSPNMASYPLDGNYLAKRHLSTLISMAESAKISSRGKTAAVIGGGLGRSGETQNTILEYLSEISIPVVIDADAIHALSKKPMIISEKSSLITPHSYEFFILTGREVIGLSKKERIKVVKEEAFRLKTTILLKGEIDIISNGKEVALVKEGSPFMTVGGTGDVLAGICGAFMAQGINPFEAGQAAALINGLAGRKAGEKIGESMLATDLIEYIPKILPGIK